MNKSQDVLKELEKYRNKDYSFASGKIIGSMCTQPHPIAKKAYIRFLETNLGDPNLFPGSYEIESKYLSFISNLLNAPRTAGSVIVSGGNESNITAIWIVKNLSKKKELLFPSSAHFSFEKLASMMDLRLVPVSLTKEYTMDLLDFKKKFSKNTLAVVGVAGSTELGTIDPVPQISDICHDEHTFLHVDAAFGGYVIPFLNKLGYDVPNFDFRLKGVSSVSIDAHKMGWSAIPLGTLIIREKSWFKSISVESHCVSSKTQSGILGTRSAGPIAAAYAVSKYLGINGYKKIVKQCMENTIYLYDNLSEIGLKIVVKPTMNIIGIRFKNPNKVAEQLSKLGWKVNIMDRISSIRIVVMPHVTRKVIDDFIPVLKKVCKNLGEI
jgi:tyrosine decarboxylase/aspartate 1-decarboxylase